MIAGLTAADIAEITGGALRADPGLAVPGPVVIDSRETAPGAIFAAMAGDHADGHRFVPGALADGAALALVTAEVEGPAVVVDDVPAAMAALARRSLEVLRERGEITVIAITGSQGKTSVKDMLAGVLGDQAPTVAPRGSFNNELGVPLTVLRADADTRYLVVEMGARGIGHIAYLCGIAPPDIGVVLNVGSAHLGEFGTPEITALAKGELVEAVGSGGVAVLNADDHRVAAMASRTAARVATFGFAGEDVRLTGEVTTDAAGHPHVLARVEGADRDLTVAQLGPHQVLNAAAALAAARAAGIATEAAVASLATAGPRSPMRMERHERADGVIVVNDAYNANPESMEAALRALAGLADTAHSVAVLGSMLELGERAREDHEAVGALAASLGIGRVIAVGDHAEDIARGAGAIAEVAATPADAIRTLDRSLRPGHVVLVKASRGERLERVADALLAADR
ncbi:UDP-N-acetylmuramoyl-tripeptide--D-alanyl-D-alanine ligase [Aeromicrobium piscarium]|uniref:UDP-N-acetylmuramoyl-tripeptide--D-alanyl-D-alanine ligase n=2 Tax=Aeromicrobium piscarium TaxID=2590901 RepID=A0A554SA38_9ACTN|nr:UDP-N-acetylmuramoyl-tripeptide--D-alanyl-D-alanine ligase [Aeromicrobium piscarium]